MVIVFQVTVKNVGDVFLRHSVVSVVVVVFSVSVVFLLISSLALVDMLKVAERAVSFPACAFMVIAGLRNAKKTSKNSRSLLVLCHITHCNFCTIHLSVKCTFLLTYFSAVGLTLLYFAA